MAHMQYEDNSPMERAHHPRPFGCGLRVTVKSVRTRTVADSGPAFSFFVTVVASTTSDCDIDVPRPPHLWHETPVL